MSRLDSASRALPQIKVCGNVLFGKIGAQLLRNCTVSLPMLDPEWETITSIYRFPATARARIEQVIAEYERWEAAKRRERTAAFPFDHNQVRKMKNRLLSLKEDIQPYLRHKFARYRGIRQFTPDLDAVVRWLESIEEEVKRDPGLKAERFSRLILVKRLDQILQQFFPAERIKDDEASLSYVAAVYKIAKVRIRTRSTGRFRLVREPKEVRNDVRTWVRDRTHDAPVV